jgi:hypothetical protein
VRLRVGLKWPINGFGTGGTIFSGFSTAVLVKFSCFAHESQSKFYL